MARIYSVAVPALALTVILDAIGWSVHPSSYALWLTRGSAPWEFLNGILFTNELWFHRLWIGSNGPYWSMGFEVPYYVAFGIAAFAPRSWALLGAAVVMTIAGPRVAALFPMWLLGLASYRFCASRPLGAWSGLGVWVVSGIAFACVLLPPHTRRALYENDLLSDHLNDLLYFYVLAVLFAANIIGFHGASRFFANVLERVAAPIRWGGQRTFALYLFHVPIIQFVVALAPWAPNAWPTRLLVFIGVPAVIFALAPFTEAQKSKWREAFALLGNRMMKLGHAQS
jgi:peptidoglycan/LPS O-acetylase OafA/YrhL